VERTQKIALASVGVGLVVLGLKFAAYWLTGSVALYSDALESTINVLAAGAAFLAIGVRPIPITPTAIIRVQGWACHGVHARRCTENIGP
jgi:hypothetical protein